MNDLNKLSVETDDSFPSLLEFAANNDIESFKKLIEIDLSVVDEAGVWYVRKRGSKQISQEERTPLMVAATYGSVGVLKLIVALPEVDLNRSCGGDQWTALHCAAFGGSEYAVDVVNLLLSAGADPNIEDARGLRPVDVIVAPQKLPGAKATLEDLLMNNISDGSVGECNLQVTISRSNASSPVLSSSPESRSTCSLSDSVSSPTAAKYADPAVNSASEKKQYPVDPSLPDIRNSIYSTDEFRMFSFKVRPCSRAYSHDWTECPFVHPGENARRRDPRKYHYSCVPCPDFRKGACRRADMCEYAHGVFECWLHPAQYRTRLCKDGTSCARQVCFFAHTQEELRPLYVSTGSGVPSPRSAASAASFMDMAAALSLFPGSPTSQSVMSPSAYNQTMSPTANGMSPSSSAAWTQPNVPTLCLPGSNMQSSRLRSSLSARDIPPEDLNMLKDFDSQQLILNEMACYSQPHPNSAMLGSCRSKASLTPSNLEELFSAEIASSPRHSDQAAAFGVFSPSHKPAVLNLFQPQQTILSPINTNVFSPRSVEHPLLQASFGVSSPRMSPRSLDAASPMSALHSPTTAWSKWGPANGKVDWSVGTDHGGYLERASSFDHKTNGEEPDLSWVQSLVKESPPEMTDKPAAAPSSGAAPSGECLKSSSQTDSVDHSVKDLRGKLWFLAVVVDRSMRSGPELLKSSSCMTQAAVFNQLNMKDLNKLSVETDDSFPSLLEFAANNDIESFKRLIEVDLSLVDEVGVWYVRKIGSKQISQEERTPLMVAATYGSVDVLKLIVALPEVDLNRSCGGDKWAALHCAAFGGSVYAFDVVKLLLSAGADPNIEDACGLRPVDVIVVPPKLPGAKAALEELLMNNISDGSVGECNLRVTISSSNASSPVLSSSPESRSTCSLSCSVSSPTAPKFVDPAVNSVSEKKQYPVDPSLPDIRNSIYSTDEFRMFSFKVRPCSRAYSHDWTECPFVHPGENARRRDPRKYHYSCVPCPDFRKGACRRGDMCEYAHGVFECWLHPAQYRTRLCKDGTSCARQVCFFAHIQEELRPLYVSTGSGVPSPRSAASAAGFMDMAAALSLLPGSPTSQPVMSPSAYNQNMSPTANGMSHSSSAAWTHPNVPTLSLPGSNLQSSRLRSSLSARDIPPEDLNMLQDYDSQQLILNEMACFSQPRPNSAMLGSGRSKAALTPSNLEELFSAEIASSPRLSDQAAAFGVFSPSHKPAVLNQFPQQQTILSPINTNAFSPRHVEHPLLHASFGVSSPRMSPRSVEAASPMSARLSAFAQHERQQQMRSLSSWDLGSNRASVVGSPTSAWSRWGSANGKVNWSAGTDHDDGCLKRSSSFDHRTDGEEPDLSWVQSLVKESPPEMMNKPAAPSSGAAPSGAWLDQMRLDQLVV
ncbi:CCCH-type zinc finger protein with ARM repeat domain-containing protein [Perilla frutescens var. hirtella]|nr:CCCH-type zinc finger protein with ARM repeat domain-containing protein [Perilla frutescens var. hirtella]